MAYMSADALQNNVSNVAKTYLWEVLFPNPPFGSAEMFTIRCQSSELPDKSLGVIPIQFKQTAGVGFPGKAQFSHNINLSFVEGEDRETFKAFYRYLDSIVNAKTGKGAIASAVKRDFYLHLLNADETVALKIKMVGTFPIRLNNVPLDFDRDADLRLGVTMWYDRWEPMDI